jgi:hypothetical protein
MIWRRGQVRGSGQEQGWAGFSPAQGTGARGPSNKGDDFAELDILRSSHERVAAADAAFAGENAGVAQREQDLLEELERDAFLLGEFLDGPGARAMPGDGRQRAQSVFSLFGDTHYSPTGLPGPSSCMRMPGLVSPS